MYKALFSEEDFFYEQLIYINIALYKVEQSDIHLASSHKIIFPQLVNFEYIMLNPYTYNICLICKSHIAN